VFWLIEMHRRKTRSSGGSSIGLECSRSSRHISFAMNCDFFEHRLHSDDAGFAAGQHNFARCWRSHL
jgi:hypothetical protein